MCPWPLPPPTGQQHRLRPGRSTFHVPRAAAFQPKARRLRKGPKPRASPWPHWPFTLRPSELVPWRRRQLTQRGKLRVAEMRHRGCPRKTRKVVCGPGKRKRAPRLTDISREQGPPVQAFNDGCVSNAGLSELRLHPLTFLIFYSPYHHLQSPRPFPHDLWNFSSRTEHPSFTLCHIYHLHRPGRPRRPQPQGLLCSTPASSGSQSGGSRPAGSPNRNLSEMQSLATLQILGIRKSNQKACLNNLREVSSSVSFYFL